jgi:hypothetical protein
MRVLNKKRDGTRRKLKLDLMPAVQKSQGTLVIKSQAKLHRSAEPMITAQLSRRSDCCLPGNRRFIIPTA